MKKCKSSHPGTDHGNKRGYSRPGGNEDGRPIGRSKSEIAMWAGEGDTAADFSSGEQGGKRALLDISNAEGKGRTDRVGDQGVVSLKFLINNPYALTGVKVK